MQFPPLNIVDVINLSMMLLCLPHQFTGSTTSNDNRESTKAQERVLTGARKPPTNRSGEEESSRSILKKHRGKSGQRKEKQAGGKQRASFRS